MEAIKETFQRCKAAKKVRPLFSVFAVSSYMTVC